MMRAIGVSKTGIHAGKMLIAGSLAISPFIEARTGYSAFDYLVGKDNAAGQPMGKRIQNAAASILYVTIGSEALFDTPGSVTKNRAICGMGVAAGAGITMAGKFVNPMLAGSAVKL